MTEDMNEHQTIATWLLTKIGSLPIVAAEAGNIPVVEQWLNDIRSGALIFTPSGTPEPSNDPDHTDQTDGTTSEPTPCETDES